MNWGKSTYAYTRERRFFGRQPLFSERHEMLVDIAPNHELMKNFYTINPMNRGTQLSTQYGASEVNTENVKYQNRGMLHVEGGWPKDIQYADEEAVTRYRKKIEREESWQNYVCDAEKPILNAISQNNAINIYENYFENIEPIELGGNYTACVLNDFRDQEVPTRQISNLCWEPSENQNFVGVYGFPNLYAPTEYSYNNYIWSVDDPIKPIACLKCPSFATCINWNPKDTHILTGALHNGSVCSWDNRVGESPVAVSPLETSHRDICSALTWVQSKSNTEFYSGSTDGTVHFWDIRKLSEPFNVFMLDPIKTDEQNIQRAQGCTVLEFEYTIPIRFMAATDKGYIFLGNRKATIPSEIMVGHFQAMSGPIKSLERNPIYVKYFLVVGDWCTKICSEDCKDSPLTRCINYNTQLNCGTWSQSRCSLYFIGREDGKVDFWDLLISQKKPIYTLNTLKSPITALKGSRDGKFLAVGTRKGEISLIKLDEELTTSGRNDRMLLSAFFEREVHRVKILEGRVREILLKLQTTKKDSEFEENLLEGEEEEDEGEEEENLENKKIIDLDKEEEYENEDELEMIKIDPLLPEINKQYLKIIEEEKERRKKIEKIFKKSSFEIQIENPDQFDARSVGGSVKHGRMNTDNENSSNEDQYSGVSYDNYSYGEESNL